jgi:type IV pilus assembly protein PilN
MYNVDINFLRNRPEFQSISAPIDRAGSDGTYKSGGFSNYSKVPIFAGVGIGVFALLASGSFWLYFTKQSEGLIAKQAELDKQLGEAKVQETKLTSLKAQIAQTEQETQSLAGVFNLVRPWSAIMKEFQDSTPQGVQILTIAQKKAAVATTAKPVANSGVAAKIGPPSVDSSGSANKPSSSPAASSSPGSSPAPSVAASPKPVVDDSPMTSIEIDGMAQSFNDVNSFVLTLKQSAFFNPDATELISSELTTSQVSVTSSSNGNNTNSQTTTSKGVKYKIRTALKQIPASELMRDLERKGAIGLVTRIKTLQQQKVIKP